MSKIRQKAAFTLVELLVVIGIIALLISALLPALNTARQQANLIDCQSRLRQMGQALTIYTVDSKGVLPWGAIYRKADRAPWITPTWQPSNADAEPIWWWYYTVGQVIDRKMVGNDGFVSRLSPIFRDRDTVDQGSSTARYFMHYTANQRLFPFNVEDDVAPAEYSNYEKNPVPASGLRLRKVSSIKTPNVFLIWDSAQCQDQGGNAYGLNSEMDGNAMYFGHCFYLGYNVYNYNYDRAVSPGGKSQSLSSAVCATAQRTMNRDLISAFDGPLGWSCQLRFRHLRNTTLNGLCLDGHVESRRVGEAMLKDFCSNYPY